MPLSKITILFIFIQFKLTFCKGQQACELQDKFILQPTSANVLQYINWDAFPQFSLPFKIIYGGPRLNDSARRPLLHGFSHLSTFSGNDNEFLPKKNRAFIWYGVAYNFNNPQPWQQIRSPWANDLPAYEKKWEIEMENFANDFTDSKGTKKPSADILMLDTERHWEGEFELASNIAILGIKNDVKVPQSYKALNDVNFIDRYKKDILNLYARPIRYLKSKNILSNVNSISAYGDVPIRFQTFNIEANTWPDWQLNPSRLSYLMKDTLTQIIGGEYYKQMDIFSPSGYIQAAYSANPKARGGDYLAEYLFQIEVNKARVEKEIIPFVWLKYEDLSLSGSRYIKPYQAEALAIFPFFSGAKGLWLWDDPTTFGTAENLNTYEYFINGLFKLSLYKYFFEGNFELILPKPARDLRVEQIPVWRAVVKGDEILVAAQNPYAKENENTSLLINYKNWNNIISLNGREVFLCKFKLSNIVSNEHELHVNKWALLNTQSGEKSIKIQFISRINQSLNLKIYNTIGKEFYSEKLNISTGENEIKKLFSEVPNGEYLVRLIGQNFDETKKVIFIK